MSVETHEEFPKITEEGMAALRERIGVKIGKTAEPWCYEATRDNIRHYAHGIGDDNPLWCDPDYAAQTKYGNVIAPPSFLFATNRIISGDDGDLLAEADSWCFRTDRDIAREKGTKYSEVKAGPLRVYTQEELDSYYRYYEEETIRGAEPRYWDDVREGEELPTMVKGPMTVTGFIAYAQGWGGLYIRANKLAWQQASSHPGLGIKNRRGIPDCPERVHWEEEFAHKVGVPGAYDYGPERCSWLTHHLTNWMGDDGFLQKAKCQVRRHNPEGDVILINGTVSRKFVEGDKHLVEISQRAENQDGDLSAMGSAVVELPHR